MNDKKIGVFFLLGVFLILGVYFVGAAFNWATLTGTIQRGIYQANTTLTKGGDSNLFNFTITDTGGYTTLSINITIPGNYSLSNADLISNKVNSSNSSWTFKNESSTGIFQLVWNGTDFNATGPQVGINNSVINVWINVTTKSSDEETNPIWIITLNQSFLNSTNFTTFSVDSLKPRLTLLNLTDGTGYLINGSDLTDINWTTASNINVRLTVTEANIQNVYLYYNSSTASTVGSKSNVTLNSTRLVMSTNDVGSGHVYNATIPASSYAHNTYVSFFIWANDTVGYNYNITNDTNSNIAVDAGGFTFRIDNVFPLFNISESTTTPISGRNYTNNYISINITVNDTGSGLRINSTVFTTVVACLTNATGCVGSSTGGSYQWQNLLNNTDFGDSFTKFSNGTFRTNSVEDGRYNLTFNVTDIAGNNNITVSIKNIVIDNTLPKISEINVSDGNTTLTNGTNLNYTYRFGTNTPLKVYATIRESNGEDIFLYYYTNSTKLDGTLLNKTSNAFDSSGGAFGGVTRIKMSTTDTKSYGGTLVTYLYNATIPASALQHANITSFVIRANDSAGNIYTINNSDFSVALSINITSTILKIAKINATGGSYTRSDSNLRAGNTFLGAGQLITFGVEVTGELKDAVRIYYNHTREANTTDHMLGLFVTNSSMNNLTTKSGTGITIYNTSLQQGVYNNSKVLRFLIVANDTFNYQTLTRFNLTIDGAAPTGVTVTTSASSITVGGSVTATCSASDSDPVLNYLIEYKMPSGTYSTVSSTNTYTTGTDETNTVGTYYFRCSVTDSTGHSTTGSETSFTVTATTSSSSSSSGGGGGGGGTTVTPTVTEVTEISEGETENIGTLAQTISNNIIMGLDSVASFNMATSSSPSTTSSHSITVNEITETSVTLVIESDPIELTLEIGDTETVDVDTDDTDDLEITLNDITDGQANLTVNTLVEAVAPEVTPTPTEEGVTPPTAEAKPLTGLWVIVIIVIVGLILWFLFRKKKK